MAALTDRVGYRAEPEVRASPAGDEFDIVLEPVSQPELGEIRIGESLFAVGRNEPPFSAYRPELVAELSRRHARIFSEAGAAYLADLDSKNGTTVNGEDVRQKTVKLQQDDEIRFGTLLSYRVRLSHRALTPAPTARLISLTLTPVNPELGLQPIVITRFPFLLSKAEAAFSLYKETFPEQLNYLSRRHAHVFLKGGLPWVEDLGSTNGTFVSGRRLDEHAAPLAEGDTLAFGGHHFVYRVSLQTETAAQDPTMTKLGVPGLAAIRPSQPAAAAQATGLPGIGAGDGSDKTTFIASADSFLDIFCIDQGKQKSVDEEGTGGGATEAVKTGAGARKPRSHAMAVAAEFMQVFLGKEAGGKRRFPWRALALGLIAVGVVVFLLFRAPPDQQIRDLMADGKFGEAAQLAGHTVQRHPENAEVKALGTEALMKAHVPPWLDRLRQHDFAGAEKEIAAMKTIALNNDDALPLIARLGWLGKLEQYMAARGGMEAPLRIYADEDGIVTFLREWNDDAQRHQRDFARIASLVPQFADPYALALSHLRKLQSDEAVYLSAIARLKTAIDADLDKEQADAVEAMLNDYADKYPRLKGMDAIRQDLQKYLALENAARARDLPKVASLLASGGIATPQFQAKVQALSRKDALPPEAVIRQYAAVSGEWRQGHAEQAMAALQGMAAGAWSDALGNEARRKQAVLDSYAALRKTGAMDDDRLIAFYGSLDAEEDVYFLRAVEGDLGKVRDKALRHAQELQGHAQSEWRRYRDNGSIAGEQRMEPAVSSGYRNQARALAQAREDARQAMQLYTRLKADVPEPLARLRDDIEREVDSQRRSLMELNRQLEPGLLKAKLALLGRENGEGRSAAKTAN
jgi:pSer/pThr/pTyr-binding forkhead associated (FHA) protein